MDVKNASAVCPLKVLPDASVMVPDTIIGSLNPFSSNISSIAKRHALAFKVSNIVSTKRRSTPPSMSAVVCSL
jgi:hypothetical protein